MDEEIRALSVDIVYYLARNTVTGGHNQSIETVVSNAPIASHDEGKAKEAVNTMIRDPDIPVERYGGQRGTIRLSDMDAAVAYIEKYGDEPP